MQLDMNICLKEDIDLRLGITFSTTENTRVSAADDSNVLAAEEKQQPQVRMGGYVLRIQCEHRLKLAHRELGLLLLQILLCRTGMRCKQFLAIG